MYKIIRNSSDYSLEERKFLRQWINGKDFQRKIKAMYYKNFEHTQLDSMFEIYDSKYNKNISIYRGISFFKGHQDSLNLYQKVKNTIMSAHENKLAYVMDFAPSSFTRKPKTAKWFGKVEDDNYKSIVYDLSLRNSNEIDVCSNELALKSTYKYEEELIVATNKITFKVLDIIEKDDIMKVKLKEIYENN